MPYSGPRSSSKDFNLQSELTSAILPIYGAQYIPENSQFQNRLTASSSYIDASDPGALIQGLSFRPGDDLYASFASSPHGPRELSVAMQENRCSVVPCNDTPSAKIKIANARDANLNQSTLVFPLANGSATPAQISDIGSLKGFANNTLTSHRESSIGPIALNGKQHGVISGKQNVSDSNDATIAAIRAITARSVSNSSTSTQRRRTKATTSGGINTRKDT